MASLRFWKRKKRKRQEQCETCGRWVPENKAIIITEVFADDMSIGIDMGHTAMSASFCRRHDPRRTSDAT